MLSPLAYLGQSAAMDLLSEPIQVEMPEDAPVLPHPRAFLWRGERYEVARLLERWTDAGFSDRRRGKHHWWERRHRDYFRVKTTDGSTWDLYLDRSGGRRKWYVGRRWEAEEEIEPGRQR